MTSITVLPSKVDRGIGGNSPSSPRYLEPGFSALHPEDILSKHIIAPEVILQLLRRLAASTI